MSADAPAPEGRWGPTADEFPGAREPVTVCPTWLDGVHWFAMMRATGDKPLTLVQVVDPSRSTHKICACGLVVPRR